MRRAAAIAINRLGSLRWRAWRDRPGNGPLRIDRRGGLRCLLELLAYWLEIFCRHGLSGFDPAAALGTKNGICGQLGTALLTIFHDLFLPAYRLSKI